MKRILDPRIHLITLLLATVFICLIQTQVQLHFMMAISVLYVLVDGKYRRAVMFVCMYMVMAVFIPFLSGGAGGIATSVFLLMRMLPIFSIGSILASSSPSVLLYVSDRMHLPHHVIIMICILLRFSSMIWREMASVGQGIRARGLLPHWYSIILHPVQSYECFVLPLIIRGLRLSSELTSAAEFRGMESTCRRSSLYDLSQWFVNVGIVSGYTVLALTVYLWVR